MANVLDQIIEHKRDEIAAAKLSRSIDELKSAVANVPACRDFLGSLKSHHPMGMIAEVKRASPSAGLIREDFDPVEIARTYEANGAACISVLTDENFFKGKLSDLISVREQVTIPVLRKDFLLDEYQVYEARCAGADAVLLIAECLDDAQLSGLNALARDLGMQTLIEVYEPDNLDRVLRLAPPLIGVNNRNLQTFQTSLDHSINLRQRVPQEVLLVGESGIHTRDDVLHLQSNGIHAILVGESLMRKSDIGAGVRELLGIDPDDHQED